MHNEELPISQWIDLARGGDEEAFEHLWLHFYGKLVSLARSVSHKSSTKSFEEDVAQSTLASFYFRFHEGRYPDLHDRLGLWKLLMTITLSKSKAIVRKESRRYEILREEFTGRLHDALLNDFTAELSEQLGDLLQRLPNGELRDVASAKLDGYSNREIADQIGKSVPTVERKLRLIREFWSGQRSNVL